MCDVEESKDQESRDQESRGQQSQQQQRPDLLGIGLFPPRPPDRAPGDPGFLEPATISAEELHRETALSAAIENGGKLRLAYRLLAWEETRLHNQISCSSVQEYAERYYRRDHRQTVEMIRVARALRDLPKLQEAFLMGSLDWSCLEHLSRVATGESEEDWLAFAAEKPVRVIKMEVEDALEKKRKRPRKDGYSLPNANVFLTFKLRRTQYEVVNQGMGRVSQEMQLRLGGQKPRPEEILVLMSQRFLETDPEGKVNGREEKDDSLFTILYRVCPPCRQEGRPSAAMMTPDGPVEVPIGEVEQVEAEAKKVTIRPEDEMPSPPDSNGPDANGAANPPRIDRPNPPSLLRKLKLRAGATCENPFCRRRIALQGDHLLERSKGGPTELWNEALLCVWCHALRTQGLLEIRRDPLTGELEFILHADKLQAGLEAELQQLAKVPLVLVAAPASAPAAPNAPNAPNGANGSNGSKGFNGSNGAGAASPPPPTRTGYATDEGLELVASGLVGLGYKKRESKEALLEARDLLESQKERLTGESLLKKAIQILSPNRSAFREEPG